MTDEGMGQSEDSTPEPEEMTKPEGGQSPLAGAVDFTSGEGLVALAGMIILALWIIFDVITDDYDFGFVTLLLALLVVLVPRLRPETVAKVHPVAVIMKVTGYTLGFIGVFDVIEVIEGGGFDDDALTVITALVSYAAFAVAFIGARQIKI